MQKTHLTIFNLLVSNWQIPLKRLIHSCADKSNLKLLTTLRNGNSNTEVYEAFQKLKERNFILLVSDYEKLLSLGYKQPQILREFKKSYNLTELAAFYLLEKQDSQVILDFLLKNPINFDLCRVICYYLWKENFNRKSLDLVYNAIKCKNVKSNLMLLNFLLKGYSKLNDPIIRQIHYDLKNIDEIPTKELKILQCDNLIVAHTALQDYRAVRRLYDAEYGKNIASNSFIFAQYLIALFQTDRLYEIRNLIKANFDFLVLDDKGIEICLKVLFQLDKYLLQRFKQKYIETIAKNIEIKPKSKSGLLLLKPIISRQQIREIKTAKSRLDEWAVTMTSILSVNDEIEIPTIKSIQYCMQLHLNISDMEESSRLFHFYKSKRTMQISAENKRNNLPYTTKEMCALIQKNSPFAHNLKSYNLIEVPRTIIAQYIKPMAMAGDSKSIKLFFEENVEIDALDFYWSRYIRNYKYELKLIQEKSLKCYDEQKSTSDWINKKKMHLKYQLGVKGPLEIVYQTIIDCWRSDDVLLLDCLIRELEEMELQLLKNCSCFDSIS
jgi:hypothetical protein